MKSCIGLCDVLRKEYLDYDNHGNWLRMHEYKLINDTKELQFIEIREIAYSKEDVSKLEESYNEVANHLYLERYNDSFPP